MPSAIQAGLWGLLSDCGRDRSRRRRDLAMIIDTMIPEAFDKAQEYAGLITVAGFLAAFALTKLNH